MVIKLFDAEVLSLVKAEKLAQVSVEYFMKKLALLDMSVVNQSTTELDENLSA